MADPLIKTPFNLKKRVVKGVHGGDHAELLTPCLWRLVVMGYGPGECDPFQRHILTAFSPGDDLISRQPSTALQPGCASHVF